MKNTGKVKKQSILIVCLAKSERSEQRVHAIEEEMLPKPERPQLETSTTFRCGILLNGDLIQMLVWWGLGFRGPCVKAACEWVPVQDLGEVLQQSTPT